MVTEAPRFWNALRIERDGDTLHFLVGREPHPITYTHVASHTDAGLPETLYVGFFVYHANPRLGGMIWCGRYIPHK